MSPKFRKLTPLAAIPFLYNCATIQQALNFQEPQVALEEINITGLTMSGGTLDLVFDVYNPNTYRITSTRLELKIDLEDRSFGDVLMDRPLDLSAEYHSEVTLPVRFEWAGVGAGMRALLQRQALRYSLEGAAVVEPPGIGERRVALKAAGEVPLRRLIR
jgi:LEA14-like dessication related protein